MDCPGGIDLYVCVSLRISDSSHRTSENLHVANLYVSARGHAQIIENNDGFLQRQGSIHEVGAVQLLTGLFPDDLPDDVVNFFQRRLDGVRKMPALKSGPGDLDHDGVNEVPRDGLLPRGRRGTRGKGNEGCSLILLQTENLD